MLHIRLLGKIIILVAVVIAVRPDCSVARQTIVIGALSFGYDYWERTYDKDGDENLIVDEHAGDKRDFAAWPEIEIQSNGIHDTLSFRYAPVLKYDDIYYSTDVDHYLSLAAERFVTQKWDISLRNDYVLTDDPTRYGTSFDSAVEGESETGGQVEQTPDEITQNLGRRRYWTNNLLLGTTYAYAEDSDAGLGYAYRVLRNDSSDEGLVGYDEYDRHEFSGLWSHKFSPSWKSQLDLRYIKGLYEDVNDTVFSEIDVPLSPSQDLQEYWADLRLDYDVSKKDAIPFIYRYRDTQYDGLRQDIWVHELALGWDRTFDSRTHLTISAGPSYVDADEQDGEWGYNAYLNFTRSYQHGRISALIDKRTDPRNFTGSRDTGLTDITDLRVEGTYEFTKDISSSVFGQYRYEDILDPQGAYYLSALGDRDPMTVENVGDVTYSRESYLAGASVDYAFLKWYVASLRYEYFQQDGDLLRDSYSDHRVMFVVTASKELWRK